MDPARLAFILKLADSFMVCRYANTAGATAWFYDYLLTFQKEYQYIWKKKWGLVKILYLLNRYLTPPFLILVLYHLDGEQRGPLSTEFCIFYDIMATVLRGAQLFASTWLILIVVQALSLNNRHMKVVLYTLFTLMTIAVTVFGVITLKEMYPTIAYSDILDICSSNAPASTRWLYMAQVPFDLFLVGVELFYYWRLQRSIAPAEPTRLLKAMYLDGVWYFLATFTIKLMAASLIIFVDPAYWYVATSADQALTSTLIARLVLHLREVACHSTDVSYADTDDSRRRRRFKSPYTTDEIYTGPTITITMDGDRPHESRLDGPAGNSAGMRESVCRTREDDDDDEWKVGGANDLEMDKINVIRAPTGQPQLEYLGG